MMNSQGWKQFLTAKKEMLDAFDQSRDKTTARRVKTHHGNVAEAEFRDWLGKFLPKKYAATAGYVVSQGKHQISYLSHYDLIIYDALESPVLWIESSSDISTSGQSRAIPVEYVRAIIEVKAALQPSTAKEAINHLFELEPFLSGTDAPNERYKTYLPPDFFSAIVFFELRAKDKFSKAALRNLAPAKYLRGYFGGLVLRGERLPLDAAGRVEMYCTDSISNVPTAKRKTSLIGGMSFSDPKLYTDGLYCGTMIRWSDIEFATFANDMVAKLNGAYELGKLSSFHGLPFGVSLSKKPKD